MIFLSQQVGNIWSFPGRLFTTFFTLNWCLLKASSPSQAPPSWRIWVSVPTPLFQPTRCWDASRKTSARCRKIVKKTLLDWELNIEMLPLKRVEALWYLVGGSCYLIHGLKKMIPQKKLLVCKWLSTCKQNNQNCWTVPWTFLGGRFIWNLKQHRGPTPTA